ncbi:hypothetical protein V2J09_014689 [Rumex salicifolius]
MFKTARWRADKNKITALFKLRFHASQVSQLDGNALVLSLVPADTGRPTAKLDKFEIRDGCCYWENPIFETVKLIQDPKTGKIQERIIYFIISTGLSKLSILGEVSVNIAEYAGATEAASVSLPFKGSSTDVILHVLIQRIQEKVTSQSNRELEVCNIAKIRPEEVWSLQRHFSNVDTEENISVHSTDEQSLKKDISNTSEVIGNRRRASIGSDITLSSSDSSSGLNTPLNLGRKNNAMLLDSVAHNHEQTGVTGWELALVPTHDSSADGSIQSPRNGLPNGRCQLDGGNSLDKLKADLVTLSRKAEVADLELQTLRKQIIRESKRGQDLLKEVGSLKVEREALKEECEKLKASQKCKDEMKARNKVYYEGDPWTLLEETRQELNYVKEYNVNLQLQLQKTQESNSELIFAVQDLEQMLEQSKSVTFDLSTQPMFNKIPEFLEERGMEEQGRSDDDEEQKALEEIVRQHSDAKETYILEQKIMDLCSEIEMYRRDKDEVEIQLEQLALDYEILKQENHDMSNILGQTHAQEQLKLQYECSSSYAVINELENRVQKLERELKERSDDFSGSLATIKEQENHIHNLEDELEKQAQRFKDELEVATHAKAEKEQEAILANEYLRLAKVELKNRIEKLEDMQSREYLDALSTLKVLENEIQFLETELDKHAQGFESDLEAVIRAKVEQEHRAIRAEEALRLTKWKNTNTAERLQEEFRRLSMQMQSTFKANEKLATNARTEASQLQLVNKHLEDLLEQAKEELQSVKDDYEAQVNDLHNQLGLKSKQIDQLLMDIEEKSDQLNREDRICRSFSAELLTLRAEMDSLTSDTASLAAQIEETDLKAELEKVNILMKERDLLSQREINEREILKEALNSAKKDAVKSTEELNVVKCSANEKDLALSNLQSEVDTLRGQCEELRHSFYLDELEKETLRTRVIQLVDELKKKDDEVITMERELKNCSSQAMGQEDANNLKEHIKLLEAQIMQKETALDTSENAFLEKKKDLHNKIEELENRLDELNQSRANSCEYECREVDTNNGESKTNNDSHIPEDNGNETSTNKTEENGMELSTPTIDSRDQNDVSALSIEMASLREKNASMETELKDMQERYSEISLRFAEVEGERQKLMMTLRSVKNSKKR